MDRIPYYNQLGIFLDLAVEAHDLLRGATRKEVPGVIEEKEHFPKSTVTTITIVEPIGEKMMGKPKGTYITIESPNLRQNNPEAHQEISRLVAQKLQIMMQKLGTTTGVVLLVGLGNWEATPDALGPRVTEHALVTRHLHQYAPQVIPPDWRSVSAITPGVMGLTGIETAEIVKGVVERVKPTLIIAIDALAAQNVNRIGATVQLADTGINPGSGIGNLRNGISMQTMGVPVIAIGVPTVVHAAIIAYEVYNQIRSGNPAVNNFLPPPVVQNVISQILTPFGGNLTVTPKEIDDLVERIARVLSLGINQGLYPEATLEELTSLTNL